MKEHPEEFYLQEQHPTIRRLADLIEAAEPPQMSSKSERSSPLGAVRCR